MRNLASDRPGIIPPPPAIYLAFLGLGLLLEWLWPIHILRRDLAVGVGLAILVCGVNGLALAIHAIRHAQSPISPYKPAKVLVTAGPFRFSRNPIYASDTLLYVGLSMLLNALWALALTPVLIWTVQVGVIAREEEYLERRFGDDYGRYKHRVQRWL